MWIFNSNQNNRDDDYWAKVADREFKALDKEGQAQWSELR